MKKSASPAASLPEVDQFSFVLPRQLLEQRTRAGEGVREDDVPVHDDTYAALEVVAGMSQRVRNVTVDTLRDDTIGIGDVDMKQGRGRKAYPFAMSGGLKPVHSAERKQHVCEALAQELHRILVESISERSARFGQPYADLTSAGETNIELKTYDLRRLGISLRPGENNNPALIKWIGSEVGPMLTRLLVGDDHLKSSWIIVYAEDAGVGGLGLRLVRRENQASDGE